MTETPHVTAVVLAYGEEPHLTECVEALLGSRGVFVEVVLVDNGAAAARVQQASSHQNVRLLTSAENLGYAGGCNLAAHHAGGDYLAFVNSDAIVDADCLLQMVRVLRDESVGLVSASVRLGSDPYVLNSAGNPLQFLFFSWAGGFGEPASAHPVPQVVASVSGATFALRRAVWERLGGFDDVYFAYGEDVDLSWRAWQAGLRVLYEPSAVSVHHYEFARNARKFYLLERNRLINYLTLTDDRMRRVLAPMLLVVEVGVLVVAIRDGWGGQKLGSWRWLLANHPYLAQRRIRVAESRRVDDIDLLWLVQARIDPSPGLGQSVPGALNWLLERYWRTARRVLTHSGRRGSDRAPEQQSR